MSTMGKRQVRGVAVWMAVIVVCTATSAWAQHDAGAKMRGEFGRFWGRSTTATRVVAPSSTPAVETRRSFSAEPGLAPVQKDEDAVQKHVAPKDAIQKSPQQKPATEGASESTAAIERRTYSYEPAMVTRSRGSRRPSYLLPKTDPRRYDW